MLSGQLGSTRSALSYGSSSDTLLGGIAFKPFEALRIGLDVAWNQADASFDPFEYVVPERFVNANQSYDLSQSDTYSDLDVSRLEAALDARWALSERLFLTGNARWVDFQDDAPYLADTTGTVTWYSLGVGWSWR